ncbi:unnamed protein product [Sphagnum compactum]
MGMELQQMEIKNDFKGPDMHPLIDFSKTIQTSDESSTESSNHDNEEFFDFDDFGDWISCAAEDEDRRKQVFADNNKEKISVVFQLEADMDSKRQEEASSSKLQSREKDRVTLPVKKDGSHQSPILWRLYDSESTNQKRRPPNAIGLGHPDTTEGSLNGFLLWIFSQDFGSKNATSGCSEDNFDHQIQIL